MKNIGLKAVLLVVFIIIVIAILNYREANKNVPLSDIFPDEVTYPIEVEYAEDPNIATPSVLSSDVDDEVIVIVEEEAPVKKEVQKTVHTDRTYAIQIASTKEKAKADEMIKKLKQENYDAFVKSVDLKDKGTWHRIYIGQYATKKQADEYLPVVKKDYPSAFVMFLKN